MRDINYDYLKNLPAAARDMRANLLPADQLAARGTTIMEWWGNLERIAAQHHYEVLRIAACRSLATGIAYLCYGVPGADVEDDLEQIRRKDADYGRSWLKRGPSGAFHAAARKPDRIEHQLAKHGDLLIAVTVDTREEGILDDIGDLRRYMLLWEAFWITNPHVIEV